MVSILLDDFMGIKAMIKKKKKSLVAEKGSFILFYYYFFRFILYLKILAIRGGDINAGYL